MTPPLTLEQVAAVCHAAQSAYDEQLGGRSVPWVDMPTYARHELVAIVRWLLDRPYADSRELHGAWCESMAEWGRVGSVHQRRDELVVATCRALLLPVAMGERSE